MNREKFAELRAIDVDELGINGDGFRVLSDGSVQFFRDWSWEDDTLYVNAVKIARGSNRCRFTIRRVSHFDVDLYPESMVVRARGSGEFREAI